ncbi:hypothetical protein E5D57_002654 [Metarhizium anisopliae]|nr:hypothetical protein E5D57_002654 [Metarhizium anisopliae]
MWETQRRGRGWLGLDETRYTSGTHQPTAIGSDGGLKQFVQRHDGQDDGEDQWGRRKKGQMLERGARLEWERRIEAPRVRTDSKKTLDRGSLHLQQGGSSASSRAQPGSPLV